MSREPRWLPSGDGGAKPVLGLDSRGVSHKKVTTELHHGGMKSHVCERMLTVFIACYLKCELVTSKYKSTSLDAETLEGPNPP